MKTLISILSLVLICTACGGGQKSVKVADDDTAAIYYTCRLGSEVVATSRARIAKKAVAEKSRLFVAHQEYTPITVKAAGALKPLDPATPWTLQDELLAEFAHAVVGMQKGETRPLQLQGRMPSGLPDNERFIALARTSRRPKEIKLAQDQYTQRTGKKAVVGGQVLPAQGFSGKITAVENGQVIVQVSAKPGEQIETDFGPATIGEEKDHYTVEMHPQVGTIVRTGPLLGKIVRVDKEMFTLDFGHPFGGETLLCDIEVKSLTKASSGALADKALTATGQIKQGDPVRVAYTVKSETGEMIGTSRLQELVASNLAGAAATHAESLVSPPEIVIAGGTSAVPGLAEAVIGMDPGQTKQIRLPAETAYGPADPANQAVFPRDRTIPQTTILATAEFTERFRLSAAVGQEVDWVPYFKSRVTASDQNTVTLENLAGDGDQSEDDFGTTQIHVVDQEIRIHLNPVIGAVFEANGKKGRIVRFDETFFTVDFNHPLAGKPLVIDLEVLAATSATDLKNKQLAWITDHEEGLMASGQTQKPMVLLLYADWCSWCRKMTDEVFPDLRIKMLEDDFVWVKINSDLEADLKELYGQKGFPEVLVLSAQGEVVRKIEGFKDAAALSRELSGCIQTIESAKGKAI